MMLLNGYMIGYKYHTQNGTQADADIKEGVKHRYNRLFIGIFHNNRVTIHRHVKHRDETTVEESHYID